MVHMIFPYIYFLTSYGFLYILGNYSDPKGFSR